LWKTILLFCKKTYKASKPLIMRFALILFVLSIIVATKYAQSTRVAQLVKGVAAKLQGLLLA